ncbi:MAG: pantoate--beta-alanine ligase [Bacteroidetes bacterium]|nr:pantoate--beta-alanine ligase [Bacteroidota bacterium]
MIIYKTIEGLKNSLYKAKTQGKKIGFVPTMGALHTGHLSLLEISKKENDLTLCSIFINPSQFNNQDDFIKYPITTENDILLLEKISTDILFLPSLEEMNTLKSHASFNLDGMDQILEGLHRPGHFQGVCEIVEKLLRIIHPDFLYLGEKDFQQCLVLKKLITILQLDTKIKICPILRSPSGLALSSRNQRLSETGLLHAANIFKVLSNIKTQLTTGNWQTLKETSIKNLLNNGFEKVDYLEMCDTDSLQILDEAPEKREVVILIAAFIEGVRLIDNIKTTANILTN